MKKRLLGIALMVITLVAVLTLGVSATYTVEGDPGSATYTVQSGDTTGLTDALGVATSGDTIVLPAGNFTAPSEITKSVTIIGAGSTRVPGEEGAITELEVADPIDIATDNITVSFEKLDLDADATTSSGLFNQTTGIIQLGTYAASNAEHPNAVTGITLNITDCYTIEKGTNVLNSAVALTAVTNSYINVKNSFLHGEYAFFNMSYADSDGKRGYTHDTQYVTYDIDNSTLSGWTGGNMRGMYNVFTATNCKIIGTNENSNYTNAYSSFVMSDGSIGGQYTFKDCEIYAENTGDQSQKCFAFQYGATDNTLTLIDCTYEIKMNNGVTSALLLNQSATGGTYPDTSGNKVVLEDTTYEMNTLPYSVEISEYFNIEGTELVLASVEGAVAIIGGTYYSTLSAAIDVAVTGDDIIVVGEDEYWYNDITIPTGVTLTLSDIANLTTSYGCNIINLGTLVVEEGAILSTSGTIYNAGTITEEGTITANITTLSVIVSNYSGVQSYYGSLSNALAVNIGYATFTLYADATIEGITATSTTTIDVAGHILTLTGASVVNADYGCISFTDSVGDGQVIIDSTASITNNCDLYIYCDVINNGEINTDYYMVIDRGATFTNAGSLTNTDWVLIYDGATVSNTGTVSNECVFVYTALPEDEVFDNVAYYYDDAFYFYATISNAITNASDATVYIVADCEIPSSITTDIVANGVKLTTLDNTLTLTGSVTIRNCDLSGITTLTATGIDLSYNYFSDVTNINVATLYPYYKDSDLTILVYEEGEATVVDVVSDALADALTDTSDSSAFEIIAAIDSSVIADDNSLLNALNTLDDTLVEDNAKLDVSTTITALGEESEAMDASAESVTAGDLITPDGDEVCAEAQGLAVSIIGSDDLTSYTSVTVGLTINQTAASATDEVDDETGETTTTIVVSYEITPFVSYDDGAETTVSNAEITNPVTFKLYLPSIFSTTNRATVVHKDGETTYSTDTYTVYNDGNPYVIMTVTHFSEFEVTYAEKVTSSGSTNTGTIIYPDGEETEEEEEVETEVETDDDSFKDVDSDDYFYDAVEWAVENDITSGMTTTTFAPNNDCTREQVVTFLWRAMGSPEMDAEDGFSDVDDDGYYADAVAWAIENGITQGMSDDLFGTGETATRGQIVTFLYRLAGEPEMAGDSDFTDVDAEAYYYDAVLWAVENGITDGMGDGTFAPDSPCTRAQIVTFLYRFLA